MGIGLLNAPGVVSLKEIWQRSNSTICPDYQTGLLWYEKQLVRRQKRGYVNLLK